MAMLAGSLSVGLHGVVAVVAVALIGHIAAPQPRHVELVPVEIVSPPPAPPPAPVPPPAGTATATAPAAGRQKAGALGKQARTAPQPTRPQAPTTVSRLGEVSKRSEAPAGPVSSHRAGETPEGLGLRTTGDGGGEGYGARGTGAGLEVPDAPPSSARDPRPRMPYERWTIPGAEAFARQRIVVELTIERTGKVSLVKLVSGVGAWIDTSAIELARTFEFDPALDDAGEPIACQYRWTFTIAGARP